MSDEGAASCSGAGGGEGNESASSRPSGVCVYRHSIYPPPSSSRRQLGRLQRIVIGEKSKAMRLKKQSGPVPKSRKSRSSGKLALMLQVPVDVFCEIAGHLSPLDLLHLARSTQGLRDMLMSKSARPIWRAALKVLGIPECPSDISEPQLVSLMFEKSCQGCGAPRVQKVDYSLRVRLCPGCFSLNVIRGSKLAVEMGIVTHDETIYRLCAYEDAAIVVRSAILNLPMYSRYFNFSKQRFFKPDFVDVVTKYLSYEPGSTAQKQFVEAREKVVKEITDHAEAIENWLRENSLRKAEESMSKSKSRSESIFARLRALGYTDEDFVESAYGDGSKWDSLIHQPRELTERIWKNVLPQLEETIRKRREFKAKQALQTLLRQRRAELEAYYRDYCNFWAETGIKFPPINMAELRELPEVKPLLERNSEISEDEWHEVRRQLPRVFREHRERIRGDCAAFVEKARQEAGLAPIVVDKTSDPIETILNHPSAFFARCPGEYQTVDTYDELLFHRANSIFGFPEAWPSRRLTLPRVTKYADALIRSLYWFGVTMQFMNSGAEFICNCCPQPMRKKMGWKALVIHFYEEEDVYNEMTRKLAASPNSEVRVVNDHDVNVYGELALPVPESPRGEGSISRESIPENTDSRYRCALCASIDYRPLSRPYQSRREVEAHVRSK
ncbi:hypothetical protein M0805_000847 [Coniferiporia weirii]|nr:hypothetical protein M0805_000847 [Coniferiporia weirii]